MRHRDEGGSMVIWLSGVTIVVVLLSGICLDMWRAVAAQRALATAVDASAAAGANGIDEQAWRDREELRLEPGRARSLAADNLGGQAEAASITAAAFDATPDHIVVSADMPVGLTLLRLFQTRPFVVHAQSTASPRRTP